MASKGNNPSADLPSGKSPESDLPSGKAPTNNLPSGKSPSTNLPSGKSPNQPRSTTSKPPAIKPSHVRVAQHTIELSDRNLRPYTGQDLGVKLADGRVVPIDVGADPKRAIVGYLNPDGNLRVLDRTYWSNLEIVEL